MTKTPHWLALCTHLARKSTSLPIKKFRKFTKKNHVSGISIVDTCRKVYKEQAWNSVPTSRHNHVKCQILQTPECTPLLFRRCSLLENAMHAWPFTICMVKKRAQQKEKINRRCVLSSGVYGNFIRFSHVGTNSSAFFAVCVFVFMHVYVMIVKHVSIQSFSCGFHMYAITCGGLLKTLLIWSENP